jgi:hypothetical protein
VNRNIENNQFELGVLTEQPKLLCDTPVLYDWEPVVDLSFRLSSEE